MTVLRSRQAATRVLLSAFRDRGWRDPGDTAVQIVDLIADSGSVDAYSGDLAGAITRPFIDRNGVTIAEAASEARRALSGITIDETTTEPKRLKILFFGASPIDQAHLRLDEEVREVRNRIRQSDHRDVIDLAERWAVRSSDLLDAINQERPQIIHFSGHGSAADQLVFQDDRGRTTVASKEAIAAMIETVSDEVRLVLFNNCFSEGHAIEAAKHVEAAIGMNTTIGDEAARVFAASFYAALGYGRSVERAFNQARAELMLAQIPEEKTPQLVPHRGVDPSEMVLVSTS